MNLVAKFTCNTESQRGRIRPLIKFRTKSKGKVNYKKEAKALFNILMYVLPFGTNQELGKLFTERKDLKKQNENI